VFSPSKLSLAPIGRRTNQSDETTQTDISMLGGDEELLLTTASRAQPQTYTTSLYVDRVPSAPTLNIPLQTDTEVMLLVDGSSRLESSSQHNVPSLITSPQNTSASHGVPPNGLSPPMSWQNDEIRDGQSRQNPDVRDGRKRRFLSTVEVQSSLAADGRLTLTPVTRRSVEVTEGQSGAGERSSEVMEGSSAQREWMTNVNDRHQFDRVSHSSVLRYFFTPRALRS